MCLCLLRRNCFLLRKDSQIPKCCYININLEFSIMKYFVEFFSCSVDSIWLLLRLAPHCFTCWSLIIWSMTAMFSFQYSFPTILSILCISIETCLQNVSELLSYDTNWHICSNDFCILKHGVLLSLFNFLVVIKQLFICGCYSNEYYYIFTTYFIFKFNMPYDNFMNLYTF